MRHIFPAKFRRREWLLAVLSVALAAISGWLSWGAGLGAGGALALSTLIGSVILIAAAGHDRCFFTALFTGLLVVGWFVASLIHQLFVRHESLNQELVIGFLMMFVGFVGLPSAFAWLVTLIVGYAKRAT